MGPYILKRLLYLIPVLFIVSVIVFSLIHLIPGDPATILLGTEAADEELLERVRESMGLNQPIHVQYGIWIRHVLQGDLGESISTGKPVSQLILERLPFTVELALYSLLLILILAIPFGTMAAVSSRRGVEFAFQSFTLLGLSVPDFVSGILFILVFSVSLGWFPIVNFPALTAAPLLNLKAFFLPALTLALPQAAAISRMVRSSVFDVSRQDYTRTARAKGLSERVVIYKHMLRNAMIPTLTLIGIVTGYLLGGVIVVEYVFAIPGLGRLGVNAIAQRDYPTLQAIVLFVVTAFVLVNLLVDILYAYINPRIRYE